MKTKHPKCCNMAIEYIQYSKEDNGYLLVTCPIPFKFCPWCGVDFNSHKGKA